jgi:hypothetical protein
MKTLGLIDVLQIAGFDPNIHTRLVRHQDSRYDMEELRQSEWEGHNLFELYQSYQRKPVFGTAKQIITFYGLPGTRAGFYGVYKVLDRLPASEGPGIPPSHNFGQGANFFYKLERDPQFDDFRDRLVIEWGKSAQSALSWFQELRNKEVLEILAPGRKLPTFVDYLEFSLTHNQLKDLFKNEEAHRDWKIPLSSVAGVYLILAENSGEMYVGSAYGVDGIWGRWKKYAHTGDGDDVLLRDLIKKDSSYPESFRFSVLQILPKSTAKNEALRWETLYKKKLGSRAKGLNQN